MQYDKTYVAVIILKLKLIIWPYIERWDAKCRYNIYKKKKFLVNCWQTVISKWILSTLYTICVAKKYLVPTLLHLTPTIKSLKVNYMVQMSCVIADLPVTKNAVKHFKG